MNEWTDQNGKEIVSKETYKFSNGDAVIVAKNAEGSFDYTVGSNDEYAWVRVKVSDLRPVDDASKDPLGTFRVDPITGAEYVKVRWNGWALIAPVPVRPDDTNKVSTYSDKTISGKTNRKDK